MSIPTLHIGTTGIEACTRYQMLDDIDQTGDEKPHSTSLQYCPSLLFGTLGRASLNGAALPYLFDLSIEGIHIDVRDDPQRLLQGRPKPPPPAGRYGGSLSPSALRHGR